MRIFATSVALTILVTVGAAMGAEQRPRSDADLCEAATIRAAAAENTPPDVMRAIALAETGGGRGGKGRPWPWTTNVEGVGKWHATREAAIAHIRQRESEGARSYDVGCFQINRRWHGEAFASLEEMFDPDANALYAAQFLKTLKVEAGSWTRAAGWYHSRTPELAARYRGRVETILASLPTPPTEAAMIFGVPRPARLRAGQSPTPMPERALPPGGLRLALTRLPSEGAAPPDPTRPDLAMMRRALPLFAILAVAGGAARGGSGGLVPQTQAGGPPLLAAARPLFD
ncbi:MAG: hypothetical protein ACJA1L_002188 [Paracoccaceae bacterium]|jgi:hypothetical protein